MAIKAATPEIQSRMRKAVAKIGRGANLKDPAIELEGRKDLAKLHIENQILLGRHLLTPDECVVLAKMLYKVDDPNDEDYTADAVETNAEALTRVPGIPDADGDIEDVEPDELD